MQDHHPADTDRRLTGQDRDIMGHSGDLMARAISAVVSETPGKRPKMAKDCDATPAEIWKRPRRRLRHCDCALCA